MAGEEYHTYYCSGCKCAEVRPKCVPSLCKMQAYLIT